MKAITWTTNFGGENKTHCQLVIEEIAITNASDRKNAERLTDNNQHNEVRKIALKYTNNELFKQVVVRISELEKVDLTNKEIAEYQALISFTQHYRIIF